MNELWGDEFLLPWYGKQVLAGRSPYADFFIFIGPLAAYGSALLEAIGGVGIAPFRVLNVIVVAAATLAMHGMLRFVGLGRAGAWVGAAWFPLILFAVWPMSSHQWIATSCALCSLWCVASRDVPRWRYVVAGILCASSGLVVQTVGLIVLPTLLVWTMTSGRGRTSIALLLAGMIVPVLGCSVLLVIQGAFGAFVHHAVLWPMDSYVQTGGFNDGSLALLMQQRPIQTRLSEGLIGDRFAHALILPLALAGLFTPVLGALAKRRTGESGRRGILLTAAVCLVFLVFEVGRSDLPHLAYLAPAFMLAAAAACADVGKRLPATTLTGYLITGAVIGAIRWSAVWASGPPDPVAVVRADGVIRSRVDAAIIDRIEGVRAGDKPIVYLSRGAAVLYTYWSPVFPPIDWIAAPSWGTNSPSQYQWLADFIAASGIEFVLVDNQDLGLLTDKSPIKDLLDTRYRPHAEIPAGRVFVRAAP